MHQEIGGIPLRPCEAISCVVSGYAPVHPHCYEVAAHLHL